eukprot:TRINITY_DN127_c0_g2_i1.p1 TRINITY_DN127_c0_g2~~TRINITY_DN127_c0_g2_i1.p1  ORF type:complete len:194 (-),score=28.30 TRINITY_DN127_c0_g2_i1:138-719(-)
MPVLERERVLVFFVGVVLCSIMSCSLRIMAKQNDPVWHDIKNHVKAAESFPDLQTGTKLSVSTNGSNHQLQSRGLNVVVLPSEKVGTQNDNLANFTQRARAKRSKRPNGDDMIPGAILALGAAMACVLSAVMALVVLRGPQDERRKRFLEEIGEYHRPLSDDEFSERLDEGIRTSSENLIGDEDDEITPAQAV